MGKLYKYRNIKYFLLLEEGKLLHSAPQVSHLPAVYCELWDYLNLVSLKEKRGMSIKSSQENILV